MSELEEKLWQKTNFYLRFLHFVPYIRMVAVCNNLAFGKVTEESDIDLFIVAERGHLFLVRTIVTFLFQILGVRRHGDKVAGRFCLSFFVDDSALDLSGLAIENDIYLAFWVRSMKPVIANGEIVTDFQFANRWVCEYLADPLWIDVSRLKKRGLGATFVANVLAFVFGWKFVERFLRNWQMKRAQAKAALINSEGLVVSEHVLKFHNIDRRREYRGLWEQRFAGEKISREKFLSLR